MEIQGEGKSESEVNYGEFSLSVRKMAHVRIFLAKHPENKPSNPYLNCSSLFYSTKYSFVDLLLTTSAFLFPCGFVSHVIVFVQMTQGSLRQKLGSCNAISGPRSITKDSSPNGPALEFLLAPVSPRKLGVLPYVAVPANPR